jgi:hypothetical protein
MSAAATSSDDAAEEAFRAKYGDGLRPKPRLIAKDVKHFDSADWAMRKSLDEGQRRASMDGDGDVTATATTATTAIRGAEAGMPSDSARDAGGRMGTGAREKSDASTTGWVAEQGAEVRSPILVVFNDGWRRSTGFQDVKQKNVWKQSAHRCVV